MLLRFVAGLLVGAIVAAAPFFVFDRGESSSDAAVASSTLPGTEATATEEAVSTSTTEVPWVDAGEARFESTIVLPTALWIDAELATFEYELTSLGPVRPTYVADYGESNGWIGEPGPVAVIPERWELVTGDETIEGMPSVSGSAVRFKVPAGTTLDDVAEVRLTGWRVVAPFQHVFEMSLVAGETTVLPDGASVSVQFVGDQQNGISVRFATERPEGEASLLPPVPFTKVPFYLSPVSSEWEQLRGPTEDDFQLIHPDLEPPEWVMLRYIRPQWLPVSGSVVVWKGSGR